MKMIHELMTDSKILWKRFVDHFCDDLSRQLLIMRNMFAKNDVFNSLHNYDFYRFNEFFTFIKKNLTNYDMFVNVHDWKQSIVNSLIEDEMNYDSKKKQLRNEKQI